MCGASRIFAAEELSTLVPIVQDMVFTVMLSSLISLFVYKLMVDTLAFLNAIWTLAIYIHT